MIDTLSKVVFKKFITELFGFLKKHYVHDDCEKYMTEVGLQIGRLISSEFGIGEGINKFRKILDNVSEFLDCKSEATDIEDNSLTIIIIPTALANDDIFEISFLEGLISAIGAEAFSRCSVVPEPSDEDSFIFFVRIDPEDDEENCVTQKNMEKLNLDLLKIVSDKISGLQKKINSLEYASNGKAGKSGKQDRLSDVTLIKINQELEKANIELKTKSSMLAEKNSELAFELMDSEDRIAELKSKIDKYDKIEKEKIAKTKEVEEAQKKRILDLENKLREQNTFLEISRQELKSKVLELEDTKSRLEKLNIEREKNSLEVVTSKNMIKKQEEKIKQLESEKEGLLDQVTKLETLNENMQQDFMARANKLLDEEENVFEDGSFVNKSYEIIHKFIGKESAEFLIKKALARVGKTEDDTDIFDEMTKMGFVEAISKAGKRLVESKDEYSAMIGELNKLKKQK